MLCLGGDFSKGLAQLRMRQHANIAKQAIYVAGVQSLLEGPKKLLGFQCTNIYLLQLTNDSLPLISDI